MKLVEKMNPMKRTRSMRGVKRPYTGHIAGREANAHGGNRYCGGKAWRRHKDNVVW